MLPAALTPLLELGEVMWEARESSGDSLERIFIDESVALVELVEVRDLVAPSWLYEANLLIPALLRAPPSTGSSVISRGLGVGKEPMSIESWYMTFLSQLVVGAMVVGLVIVEDTI